MWIWLRKNLLWRRANAWLKRQLYELFSVANLHEQLSW